MWGDCLQAVPTGANTMMLIAICLAGVALLVVGAVAFMRR